MDSVTVFSEHTFAHFLRSVGFIATKNCTHPTQTSASSANIRGELAGADSIVVDELESAVRLDAQSLEPLIIEEVGEGELPRGIGGGLAR